MAKFEKDLVSGSVSKNLVIFAMPFLLSNLIQTLYNVVDMIIVGQFCGTAAMSGVNIGSQATFVVTNAVFGLAVGATVLIGQYLGAGNRRAITETIGTFFTVMFILAVVITGAMLLLGDAFLELIRTPVEAMPEASGYLRITMIGSIFIFAYNALSAIMRGMGDSRNPLIFVAISAFLNILLDLLLVGAFSMGADGAAIATVISQAASAILCIIYLNRNDFIFKFKLSNFRIHRDKLAQLIRVGLPTSIQNVATGISFIFLTALVNGFGVEASAAVGAVGKLNGFAILPAAAMSSAVSAMSAQNFGAGRVDRARKTMFVSMAISFGISVVIFAIVRLFPEALLSIFSNKNDAAYETMIACGKEYLAAFSFEYLMVCFVFNFNGLFIGSGHTMISFFNSVASSVLFRIPLAYLFGIMLDWGLSGVGYGACGATAATLCFALGFYFTGRWKKLVIHVKDKPATVSE